MNLTVEIPKPLTLGEQKEFDKLKVKLFKGAKFVIFDTKTLRSKIYKRYDELMKKKLEYLAYQQYSRYLPN